MPGPRGDPRWRAGGRPAFADFGQGQGPDRRDHRKPEEHAAERPEPQDSTPEQPADRRVQTRQT
jgi:hypothetical protein